MSKQRQFPPGASARWLTSGRPSSSSPTPAWSGTRRSLERIVRDYDVSAVSDEFWRQCRPAADDSAKLRRLTYHLGNMREVSAHLELRTTGDGFPLPATPTVRASTR